jgi:glutamyl-tRNA(Gln) amidotransferase subunit D
MEKTNAKPGDLVEIHLTRIIYEGVLLESSDSGIVLLKLGTGYNIGFNKKDILKIKVLKKFSEKKSDFEIKSSSEKPHVAMIITGGTIGARYDSKTGAVSWLNSPENMFRFYPELFEKVNITKVEVPFMKASEDMGFRDWQKIAVCCEKLLNDSNIKGIIITHGTDFLHYTSSALSFFLRNLNKPVVLTYSQRSIDRASSDANLNLQCSALMAISDCAEVMLVGHANSDDDFCYAMPGTKVRKLHTSRRDAFQVVNDKPFAKIFPDRMERISEYKIRDNSKRVKVDKKFEEKVALIKFYSGQSPEILDYYFKNKFKGIVIEMSGLGHVSGNWIKKIKEISDRGVFICGVSQCINGKTDPMVYSPGRKLVDAGVIYLEDMLAETAFVKLGWVLGHNEWAKDKKIVREKMLHNFSGELNKRLTD